MTSTRNKLQDVTANVDESMGVRQTDLKPQLSPVASPKDIGRTPLRKFGQLELDRIEVDENQPREHFNEEEIQHLAGSMSEGQKQPIIVRWKGDSDVSALAGKPIRLRFVMKDADLFALKFN